MSKRWTLFMLMYMTFASSWAYAQATQPKTTQFKTKQSVSKTEKAEPIFVYVPYRKVGQVLKKEGVFLTRTQFEKWSRIVRKAQQNMQASSAVHAIWTRSLYTVKLSKTNIYLHARYTLHVLSNARNLRVHLPFQGLPLEQVKIDGRSALVYTTQLHRGYTLLVQGKGTHTVDIRAKGSVRRTAGWHHIHIRIPPTPQTAVHIQSPNHWNVQMDKKALSATPKKSKVVQQKSLFFTQNVGPRSALNIRWRPKVEGVQTTQKTMMSAKVHIESQLNESVVRTRAKVHVHILQGHMQVIRIHFPASEKCIAVHGGSLLRRWSLLRRGSKKELRLVLRKALKGRYTVQLQLEHLTSSKQKIERIPSIEVQQAQWQHGWIGIYPTRTLDVKVLRSTGTTQMDVDEYAARQKSSKPRQAFMYLQPQYALQLELKRIQPRLRAKVQHRIHLDDKEAILRTRIRFRVERTGVFRFRFKLPTKWIFRDVQCPAMHNYYKDKNNQLVVALREKQGGPQLVHAIAPQRLWLTVQRILGWDFLRQLRSSHQNTLRSRVQKKKAIAQLQRLFGLQKTQKSKHIDCTLSFRHTIRDLRQDLPLQLPYPLDVEEQSGIIGIALPEHLELETQKRTGLIPIDDLNRITTQLPKGMYALRQAFRFVGKQLSGQLHLKRKKTSVHASIWMPLQLREDGYKIQGTVRYNVRYAGVKKIHLSVPLAFAKSIQFLTSTRETHKKTTKKRVEYTFLLHKKIPKNSVFKLRFSVTIPYEKALRIGALKALRVPALSVPQAVRHTVYWGLKKGESLSMQVTQSPGYERLDVTDIPKWVSSQKMARLLRSSRKRPKSLHMILRKHHYARVLSTHLALQHFVATVDANSVVHAVTLLKVMNRGRQFLKVRLPLKSRVMRLRVAGQERYRFELDSKGELLIDLTNHTHGRSFHVAIQYKYTLSPKYSLQKAWGRIQITGPKVLDVPVYRSSTRLYLPSRNTYTHFQTKSWHTNNTTGLWELLRKTLWGAESYMGYVALHEIRLLRNQNRALLRRLPIQGAGYVFDSQTSDLSFTVDYRSHFIECIVELFFACVIALILWFFVSLKRPQWSRISISVGMFMFLLILSAVLPTTWMQASYAGLFMWLSVNLFWAGRTVFRLLPQWIPAPHAEDMTSKTEETDVSEEGSIETQPATEQDGESEQ